jgi:hypothetical protein
MGGVEHWTCAHLVAQAPRSPSQNDLSEILRECIEDLRHIQLAVHLDTGRRGSLVAMETLPVLVPYYLAGFDEGPAPDASSLRLLHLLGPWQLEHADPPNPSSEENRLKEALNTHRNNPKHFAHRRFGWAAETQLSHGDYHAAILSAATSCEHLLDFTLSLLLWEEAFTPEQGAKVMRGRLEGRATEIEKRIGGEWGVDREGPFRDWHINIRRPRNAAIHRGEEPTGAQAQAAIKTMRLLSTYIGRLMRDVVSIERYPRSAYIFNPSSARGVSLNSLLNDFRQPPWIPTLNRWREACDIALKALKKWPIVDSASRPGCVVALFTANRSTKWAYWREDDGIAALIEPPPTLLPAQLEALNSLRETQSGPVCVRFLGMEPPGPLQDELAPQGSWVLEYRLIPDRGVMVNRSDLDLLLS